MRQPSSPSRQTPSSSAGLARAASSQAPSSRWHLAAIEVKSGKAGKTEGLAEFCKHFPDAHPLVVGSQNLTAERFLMDEPPLL